MAQQLSFDDYAARQAVQARDVGMIESAFAEALTGSNFAEVAYAAICLHGCEGGGMKEQRQYAEAVTLVDDGLIIALWKQGLDTVDIAAQLRLHEHQVANRLLHLREAARP